MMNARIRHAAHALVAATIISLATLLSYSTAAAQCATIDVFNFAPNCTVNLCLATSSGKLCWIIPAIMPPSPPTTITLPPGTVVTGIYDWNNVVHALPCTGLMQVGPNCCSDICFDPVNCRITITRGPFPC